MNTDDLREIAEAQRLLREVREGIEQLRKENSRLIDWWRARYNDLVETLTAASDGKKVSTDDNREFPLSNGAKELVRRVRRETTKGNDRE